MQLRLALAMLCAATVARADDQFTAKTQVYADSDHTTVVSPLVAISKDAWRDGTLSASYVADVVSSASVDVVSNATKHMSDFRSEVTGSIAQKWRATTFSGAYIYSRENDYSSHNVNLAIAQDLFQHNTTLALSWAFSDNAIGRTGDQAFHRSLLVNGIVASVTQTLSPSTIGQLSYTFTYDDGFQSSPYRFVPVVAANGSTSYKVPETMPLSRYRHAIVGGLTQHVLSDSALHADVRFYADNWGLRAYTGQAHWQLAWRDVTFRVRERFYYQSGVSFFETRYTELQPFMTTDRESSTFWSNLAGVRVAWRLPVAKRALELEAKGDVLYIRYLDYALLQHRTGGVGELGLNVIY